MIIPRNAVLGAMTCALLSGCSSIESTHLIRDQYGVVKGEKFNGVPIVVTVPDKYGFLVTVSTYRVSRQATTDLGEAIPGKVIITEETVTQLDRNPIPLGGSEVFTVDTKRPISGTAKGEITLEGQYPKSIKTDITDNTLKDATDALVKLDGLRENADTGGGSNAGETRTLVRTNQYMLVYDPRTGQFTRH
jgi:hypothetical protein